MLSNEVNSVDNLKDNFFKTIESPLVVKKIDGTRHEEYLKIIKGINESGQPNLSKEQHAHILCYLMALMRYRYTSEYTENVESSQLEDIKAIFNQFYSSFRNKYKRNEYFTLTHYINRKPVLYAYASLLSYAVYRGYNDAIPLLFFDTPDKLEQRLKVLKAYKLAFEDSHSLQYFIGKGDYEPIIKTYDDYCKLYNEHLRKNPSHYFASTVFKNQFKDMEGLKKECQRGIDIVKRRDGEINNLIDIFKTAELTTKLVVDAVNQLTSYDAYQLHSRYAEFISTLNDSLGVVLNDKEISFDDALNLYNSLMLLKSSNRMEQVSTKMKVLKKLFRLYKEQPESERKGAGYAVILKRLHELFCDIKNLAIDNKNLIKSFKLNHYKIANNVCESLYQYITSDNFDMNYRDLMACKDLIMDIASDYSSDHFLRGQSLFFENNDKIQSKLREIKNEIGGIEMEIEQKDIFTISKDKISKEKFNIFTTVIEEGVNKISELFDDYIKNAKPVIKQGLQEFMAQYIKEKFAILMREHFSYLYEYKDTVSIIFANKEMTLSERGSTHGDFAFTLAQYDGQKKSSDFPRHKFEETLIKSLINIFKMLDVNIDDYYESCETLTNNIPEQEQIKTSEVLWSATKELNITSTEEYLKSIIKKQIKDFYIMQYLSRLACLYENITQCKNYNKHLAYPVFLELLADAVDSSYNLLYKQVGYSEEHYTLDIYRSYLSLFKHDANLTALKDSLIINKIQSKLLHILNKILDNLTDDSINKINERIHYLKTINLTGSIDDQTKEQVNIILGKLQGDVTEDSPLHLTQLEVVINAINVIDKNGDNYSRLLETIENIKSAHLTKESQYFEEISKNFNDYINNPNIYLNSIETVCDEIIADKHFKGDADALLLIYKHIVMNVIVAIQADVRLYPVHSLVEMTGNTLKIDQKDIDASLKKVAFIIDNDPKFQVAKLKEEQIAKVKKQVKTIFGYDNNNIDLQLLNGLCEKIMSDRYLKNDTDARLNIYHDIAINILALLQQNVRISDVILLVEKLGKKLEIPQKDIDSHANKVESAIKLLTDSITNLNNSSTSIVNEKLRESGERLDTAEERVTTETKKEKKTEKDSFFQFVSNGLRQIVIKKVSPNKEANNTNVNMNYDDATSATDLNNIF